ncbi:MAG: tRNA-(ms[2]io[6]A)-hydroxylase [Gemmatimonadetes bacterium]|nr:tRNA-(ms[2]io[6]A)-hydroxylase [Gemmatimonadota bacterium]
MKLRTATPDAWTEAVLADFNAFLTDHANCERKASATGMLFVVRYADRPALTDRLIEFAQEELEHFQRVWRVMEARGLQLGADTINPYAAGLLAQVRHGRDERLLDRLLVAGLLEARGCERFGILAQVLDPGDVRDMYRDFTRADARHQRLFLDLAGECFDDATVQARADELLDLEAGLVRTVPVRPALYG